MWPYRSIVVEVEEIEYFTWGTWVCLFFGPSVCDFLLIQGRRRKKKSYRTNDDSSSRAHSELKISFILTGNWLMPWTKYSGMCSPVHPMEKWSVLTVSHNANDTRETRVFKHMYLLCQSVCVFVCLFVCLFVFFLCDVVMFLYVVVSSSSFFTCILFMYEEWEELKDREKISYNISADFNVSVCLSFFSLW